MPGDLLLFASIVVGGSLLLLAFAIGYWINKVAPKDPLSLARNKASIEAALAEAVLNTRRSERKRVQCPKCRANIAVEESANENNV
jgi:hypothetical protein